MSTEPAVSPALATLRRARAQQEAALRWTRRLVPPLFVVVVAVTFTSDRRPGIPGRDVAAVLAVGGLALGALGALSGLMLQLEGARMLAAGDPGGFRVELRVPA